MKRSLQFICLLGLMLVGISLFAQVAENPRTYCNPMNLDYRFMVDAEDSREAADPVMVVYHDEYYLFASRSGGYWISDDMRDWDLIVPTGLDVETYAPGVVVMRDSLFYVPSATTQVYKSGDPKSGVWEEGPTIDSYGDPCFFVDDDERLYMYYGLSNVTPTYVVELDPYTFEEISDVVVIATAQADIHGWERRGDDNLLDEEPWIEGSWMVKNNGKYYLHYSGPGTEFLTYADGIYVADSPLGPFTYADYSPFSFKPTGFISGAGHGSTFKDKNGEYWRVVTMSISNFHSFERRLGLYPVDFDADGQIRCNTAWGDYPSYYPGEKENYLEDHFAGMMLLSDKKFVTASSSMEDHPASYASDENVRTYWSATSGGDEWMIMDLGKLCSIEAIQVNLAEQNTVPELVRGRDVDIYEQYTLEMSEDGVTWEMLLDRSQNLKDMPHDYVELVEPVNTRYLKLSNVYTPGNGNFAVRDLRVFGNSDLAVITSVSDFTVNRSEADGRDAVIRWEPVEGADGYIVYYGIAPDKLYNDYMVYDADSVAIHSLNHGVNYYFEVDAFDGGTDFYVPVGEFRSSQSGDWNEPASWAWHNGTSWVSPAPSVPTADDGVISVLDGDTITVSTNLTVDQLQIEAGGVLVIQPGATLSVQDGIGDDLSVTGQVTCQGSIDKVGSSTVSFAGGTYDHAQDGGSLPSAIWRQGSTCLISGVVDDAPSNGNQDFCNVIWNCPDQTGNESMKWSGKTISGNITIENTGAGRWQMCAPSDGSEATVTILGDVVQTGGTFSSNGTGNANTIITIYQKGNIDVSGGNFSVSRGSQGGSGTTDWYVEGTLVSLQNATTQNSNPDGARFIFANQSETQSLVLDQVTYGGGGFPVQVDPDVVLDLGTTILEGSGSLTLKAGSTLATALENGIDGCIATTGTVTMDPEAGYGFTGSQAQVTGTLMPENVSHLLISNSQNVTLSKSLIVKNRVEIADGALLAGDFMLQYGEAATLVYSGSSAQTTTDVEFPATNGPQTLINANERRLTLHASRTVSHVDLQEKMVLGADVVLTTQTIVNTSSSEFLSTTDGGTLQVLDVGSTQVLFPLGTTSYAPVWISNAGTPDAVTIGVVKDTEKPSEDGRVNVKWNVSEAEEGGGDYTIQFGWLNGLENADFRNDREGNAKIYNLSQGAEAGSGAYTLQMDDLLRYVGRSGITTLGSFAVGNFGNLSDVEEIAGIPTQFELNQNYPNPFNPTTKIEFSLPVQSTVTLKVFNLLGEEVARLVSEKQFSAGYHHVTFDASHMASGLYLYTIETKDFAKTHKMMLMK